MRILILSLIPLIYLINNASPQCTSDTIPTSLATLTQYEVGSEGDSYYSHFLVNGGASFTYGNASAEALYQLTAYAISAATTNCTSSCLTSVSAYYKTDSDKLTLIMLRPSDESLYPNYTSMGLPPFYCATVSGNCGSTKPLYQFYSSTYDDYYADTEQQNNTNATYSVAMMGLPLCYLWVPTTTTTTTTTTTPSSLNTTTVTVPINGTTTTSSSNETTTASPTNGTTTTVPVNGTTTASSNVTTSTPSSGNVTTTTVSSGNTTTVPSSGNNSTNSPGGGNDSGSNTDDDGEKKGWWHTWRWPIIVAACLIGASMVLSIITCLTCCFIGSAAVAAKPYSPPPMYSSPSPPELPPNPVEAPSVTPFTVGLPPTVPY